MEYKKLVTGEEIPVLGLGTWRMGGSLHPDYSQDSQVVELFQDRIQLGYTHIDTAEVYADGHTEELVGRAASDFPRKSLFITTKIWHTNLGYSAVARIYRSLADTPEQRVYRSLPDPQSGSATPLPETFNALNELVARGKIRNIGVSNFDLHQMQKSASALQYPDRHQPGALQPVQPCVC